jgi:sigma-B regulation protein RsbU (phosphoserine phosphatase)
MKRILVVDDNPKNIQVVSNILSKENYEIEYAQNGEEAVEIVEEEYFDLILMDVMMPKMDGYEACGKIKAMSLKSGIPVIFLTSRTDADGIAKGFKSGGVDYIFKPFNVEELLARVKTHIALKDAREELFKKNQNQQESLIYAQRIQRALLPSDQTVRKFFPDHFIIYLPKDIVSGDFYWMRQIGSKIIVAIADCTGHGVPGALMSMLGISMLNDICNKIEKPSSILNQMRARLSKSWKRESGYVKMMDGMDIAIAIIDLKNQVMEYAGALTSSLIVRGDELIEIKGDNMSVDSSQSLQDFTDQEIALHKNDKLYFYSDGYADQFGGKDYKRFKSKNLRNLILHLRNCSMDEQKKKLIEVHQKWKGDNESIDDILIFGLQIM